jgi:hypothetical protein
LLQNWHAKDCPTEEELRSRNSSLPSQRDKDLLAAPTVRLVSELNADQQRSWDYIKPLVSKYASLAGLQLFGHDHHAQFKCQGPFLSTWGDNAVSWHPSVYGHRIRAFNHAFVWLRAWRDATTELKSHLTDLNKTVESLMDEIVTKPVSIEEMLR